jgi:hypothetical protein
VLFVFPGKRQPGRIFEHADLLWRQIQLYGVFVSRIYERRR